MNNTLYISDLDGTLLNRDSIVQKTSEEIINNLIAQGMQFSIATARSWGSACKIVKALNLTLPVATYNGAFLIDPVSGKVLESSCFEREQIEFLKNAFIKADIYPLVYSFVNKEERVSWIRDKESDGIKYYLDMRKGEKRLRAVNSMDELYCGEVFYITAIGSCEELEALVPLFENDENYSYTLQQELYRDEYWLEVKRLDATKAIGVEKIKKVAGCSRVVSFGDSINDLPMFSISDEAYAVSNANPRLIEAASEVIGSCDENAVAIWLKQNVVK